MRCVGLLIGLILWVVRLVVRKGAGLGVTEVKRLDLVRANLIEIKKLLLAILPVFFIDSRIVSVLR